MNDAGMRYAGLIRPVIDRVYVRLRVGGRARVLAMYEGLGLRPGFESSFYFGLLARPMPAEAVAAGLVYAGADMTDELDQKTAFADADGTWHLTDLGRTAALAVQRELAAVAEEFWTPATPQAAAALPGLAAVPRLAELVGRLLAAGSVTGGPVFRAMVPIFEPDDASPVLRLTSQLGALRHHRADAHRAAWAAAGLTVDEVRALPAGPLRQSIEDETNRLDEPIYLALTPDERIELLAGLGALPG